MQFQTFYTPCFFNARFFVSRRLLSFLYGKKIIIIVKRRAKVRLSYIRKIRKWLLCVAGATTVYRSTELLEKEREKHEFHVYTLLLFSLFFFSSLPPPAPHSHFLLLHISLTRAKVVKFSNLRRYDMENVNFLRSIIRIAQTHRHEAHSCIHSFSYAFPCHDFSFLSFVLQGFLCASV